MSVKTFDGSGYSAKLAPISLNDALNEQEPLDFDRPRSNRRARVQCHICGHEARISVLADAKICDTCLADLPGIKTRIEAELDRTERAAIEAELNLHTAIDDAHEQTKERYGRAVALREADDPRIAAAWAKALAASDGLSLLLTLHDRSLAASQALTTAIIHSSVVLSEIARVQNDGGRAPRAVGH